MSTLESKIDNILGDYAKERMKSNADMLDSFEETVLPNRVRLSIIETMKKRKSKNKTASLFRSIRILAASFLIVCCLISATYVLATYERNEIWGIDITNNGEYYTIAIISTNQSPSSIDVLRHLTEVPFNATEIERFSGITKHTYDYYANDDLIFSLTQSASDKRTKNVDDDCIIEEIWIKENKAVFIEFPVSGTTAIFWFDGEYCYTLDSYEGLNSEELIKIAETIK